jgi:hypothetical protein
VHDQCNYFGFGPIPKPRPKLANTAPMYLLLPLGKFGSKWGDFHWAMGYVSSWKRRYLTVPFGSSKRGSCYYHYISNQERVIVVRVRYIDLYVNHNRHTFRQIQPSTSSNFNILPWLLYGTKHAQVLVVYRAIQTKPRRTKKKLETIGRYALVFFCSLFLHRKRKAKHTGNYAYNFFHSIFFALLMVSLVSKEMKTSWNRYTIRDRP